MGDTKRLEAGEVRLETARREQLELVPTNIDEPIAADHPARDGPAGRPGSTSLTAATPP